MDLETIDTGRAAEENTADDADGAAAKIDLWFRGKVECERSVEERLGAAGHVIDRAAIC